MTVYCAYGAQRREFWVGTSDPIPDVIQISAEILASIGLLVTGTEWLEPFLEPILERYVTTERFCQNGPYADPGPITLDTLAHLSTFNQVLIAYTNYFLWMAICECNPGPDIDCTLDPYPGSIIEWESGHRGWDVYGSSGANYDIRVYEAGVAIHTYLAQPGPIGVLWDIPTSEGGNESSGVRQLRGWSSVTAANPGTGFISVAGPFFNLTGGEINGYTVEICPAVEFDPPIDPPPIDPPEDPGVPAPITSECDSIAGLCAELDRLRSLIRQFALGYIGSSITPAGSIVMEGDDHASVVADAITMHVDTYPVSVSREGVDVEYFFDYDRRMQFGWWAPGNDSGWYERRAVHYIDQMSGILPPDVTRIAWHLEPGVSITATLQVRVG